MSTPPGGIERIPSPSLLLYPDRIERNIDAMLAVVGGNAEHLRPHVKTHKLGEVVRMQIEKGINQVKCSTLAELEMAAEAGVADALLAYQPVGPNIQRLLTLRRNFPETKFSALVDNPQTLAAISSAIADAGEGAISLYLDLDVGMHRTGIAPGAGALELIRQIHDSALTIYAGIHAYDGHIHESDLSERRSAFEDALGRLKDFLATLAEADLTPPAVVAGGSPTFAMHAEVADQSTIPWQCSPGTTLLWDSGYGENHPDLVFEKAAFLLTRVISKPQPGLLCLDLGHKAVSAENPIIRRVRFPDIPDASYVSQSEEHLVIETGDASQWNAGDPVLGIPWHICPTLALHDAAYLIIDNEAAGDTWSIKARSRFLDTISA